MKFGNEYSQNITNILIIYCYVTSMKCCWDPIPTNRPTASELYRRIGDWSGVEQNMFSQERKGKWKARLAELAANPQPLKKSQNLLTSKQLDYSKQLSQLLKTKDVQMEMNDDGKLFYLNDKI